MDKKIFYTLAAIFLLREEYWNSKAKENYDEVALGQTIAYDNAFNMLAYALRGDWDYLRQFG